MEGARAVSDVMMKRTCHIVDQKGGPSSDLTIAFKRPVKSVHVPFEAEAEIHCRYFSQGMRAFGEDDVQAVVCLMPLVRTYLQARCFYEGYLIYLDKPGDLGVSDFWRYIPETRSIDRATT